MVCRGRNQGHRGDELLPAVVTSTRTASRPDIRWPVTVPAASTVAIVGADDDHVAVLPVSARPLWSRTSSVAGRVLPISSWAWPNAMLTAVTTGVFFTTGGVVVSAPPHAVTTAATARQRSEGEKRIGRNGRGCHDIADRQAVTKGECWRGRAMARRRRRTTFRTSFPRTET